MTRRDLLLSAVAAQQSEGMRFVDVTKRSGIEFTHHNGAFGAKYLPETMGPGCAFLDYDNDGWLDILLVNGKDWPGHQQKRSTLKLYRNNRNGTFADVTRQAGLDLEMYGIGVAVADFNNDGFPDIYVTCLGQNHLFRNTGKGTFQDVTRQAGLSGRTGFSTSAMWVDFDRDGHLDLFVCNYVRWSPEQDIFCSLDRTKKSYCTPEAYRGTTCWLFRNRGDGTFEDVTAKSGIFDSSSKSLGVALMDYDNDGWPDIFVANDTQPNKLYRNRGDGTFRDVAVRMGVAYNEDGLARAGMGVDIADCLRTGQESIAITNFDQEMIGLYVRDGAGYTDKAQQLGIAQASRNSLGFGCFFFDPNLDGYLDLLAVNGHIDDSIRNLNRRVAYEQMPHLFLNNGKGAFGDAVKEMGQDFMQPRVARGAAYGDFDRDGDQDVLITTNHGPAFLFRNDVSNGNQSIRIKLEGRKSNRDAIGAVVRLTDSTGTQMQTVKSGSSYLSSSELTLTFGMGKRPTADRITVEWPSGRKDEFTKWMAGHTYYCVEGERPVQRTGH